LQYPNWILPQHKNIQKWGWCQVSRYWGWVTVRKERD
jgi:hypothetical protein